VSGGSEHGTIGLGDNLVEIGKQRNINLAQTTNLAFLLGPGQVSEVGIYRSSNNFTTNLTELSSSVAEGNDFRGADESEVPSIS
jgi:hypothetical protein